MLVNLVDKWKLYTVYLLSKDKEKLCLMLSLRSLSQVWEYFSSASKFVFIIPQAGKKKNWVSSKKINLYHFCPSYAFSSLLVRMVYVWYCVLQKVLQERQQKPDFLKNFLNSGTFLTSRGWSRGIMKIRHTLSLIKLCIYGPAFSPFTVTVKNTDICPNTLPNSWGLVWKIC